MVNEPVWRLATRVDRATNMWEAQRTILRCVRPAAMAHIYDDVTDGAMVNPISDVQPENAMLATAWERLELNNNVLHS